MTFQTTLNHATSGYLLMIAYCIGESIGHQTCNRFRTIWIIYFSGNKIGKWSSIPASVSFYVSPTNVSHLPYTWTQIRRSGIGQIPRSYHPNESQLEYPHRPNHKKANSTRAFIQRNLNHCPREAKSTCYLTLVRPLLEYRYACIVWDPHTVQNTQKLEAVQRRSARFLMNNYQQTSSVTSMLQTLQ